MSNTKDDLTSAGAVGLRAISFARMLWKRKGLVVMIWLVASLGGAAIVYSLPAIYRADAVILVESQRIPEQFVVSTVNAQLQDRLSNLSQQILSYERMLGIVEKYNLYRTERRRRANEEIIEMMRADISTELADNWAARKGASRPSAFRVSYQGQDPATVAMVANQLANLFVDENLRARVVQVEGTSEFLESQLAEAKRRLEEQEARLSAFKLQHNGELPEQENALIAQISQLQLRLQGTNDGIARTEQSKAMAENALTSARALLTTLEQITPEPQKSRRSEAAPVKTSGGGPPANAAQHRLDQLLTQYGENHPDIQTLRELSRLPEAQRGEALPVPAGLEADASASTAPVAGNTARPETGEQGERTFAVRESLAREKERIASLQLQQDLAARQIEALIAERRDLLARIEHIQKAIGNLPLREQEILGVKRDYENGKANYQSLLNKKIAAEMSSDMEKRQKSERFTVIDVARVPEIPVKPNRPLLYGVSCICGLFLGLVLSFAVEWRAGAILGEWELPEDTPILGRVPLIATSPSESGRRHNGVRRAVRIKPRLAMFGSAVVVVLALAATAAGFYFGRGGL